jgi:formiminoglutamate deiminase
VMATYWCERAWTGAGEIANGLVVRVEGARITDTSMSAAPPPGAKPLLGLTIPGFANCHSHAFHRALRGRTQKERGTFWTWRESMYAVAERLNPDTYYDLARGTYEEMLLAGITAVGEFHYLHHDDGGASYADRNAMGAALIAAATDAGLRIALLDACYLSSGFGRPPTGVQVRFSDRTVERWLDRVSDLPSLARPDVVIGAALHSVRAVPYDALVATAEAGLDGPLHIHLSEQVAENEQCQDIHGCTPTELLERTGVLRSRLSAVHATHLTEHDIELLGEARSFACFCPTTERDLADGVGPSRELAAAGCDLTLGSDSHAVIDPFEEMRAVETNERLVSQRRGHWSAAELMRAGGRAGHRSLGFVDAGLIQPGQWADLVTINPSTVRTAGTGASIETVAFAASPADITSIVASGKLVDLDPFDASARLEQAIMKTTS